MMPSRRSCRRLPRTGDFLELARDSAVGIYPTLFPIPGWIDESGPIEKDDLKTLLRYKNEFCQAALQFHSDAPDGVSTYNWTPHAQDGMVPHPENLRPDWGEGAKAVQMILHRKLGDPAAIRDYLQREDLDGTLHE